MMRCQQGGNFSPYLAISHRVIVPVSTVPEITEENYLDGKQRTIVRSFIALLHLHHYFSPIARHLNDHDR